jgi:hypothetical protein
MEAAWTLGGSRQAASSTQFARKLLWLLLQPHASSPVLIGVSFEGLVGQLGYQSTGDCQRTLAGEPHEDISDCGSTTANDDHHRRQAGREQITGNAFLVNELIGMLRY